MISTKIVTIVVLAILFALSSGATIPATSTYEAPYWRSENALNGSYIVTFEKSHTLEKHFVVVGSKFDVTQLHNGYFADLSNSLFYEIRKDHGVRSIEDDTIGQIDDDDPIPINWTYTPRSFSIPRALIARGDQKDPGWALRYLSATKQNPDSTEGYQYLDENGKGVDVYVFDTGIEKTATISEFDDRVIDDANFSDEDDGDENGHGTRVASVIGGNLRGVAKSVTLHSVKFFQNDAPRAGTFVRAMNQVIERHKEQKTKPGFKGSIINMSFSLGRTAATDDVLEAAYKAGITLVASAGNRGYDSNHYPSKNMYVISVGLIGKDYKPGETSNYGQKNVRFWAPGKNVRVLDKNGKGAIASGTSFAAGYVSGILAIFYGVEGKELTTLAEALGRLIQNADTRYIDFSGDKDWRRSPDILVNTGYLKGQKEDPKVPYLGGPPLGNSASGTSSSDPELKPTQVCQSPNHGSPLKSFTLDQGETAIGSFSGKCQVELSPGQTEGCILYFIACSKDSSAKAKDVVLSVQQLTWAKGVTSSWPDVQDMVDAAGSIMRKCDPDTDTEKWGGFKIVESVNGMMMYNVSANQNGQYPERNHFETAKFTSGGLSCG